MEDCGAEMPSNTVPYANNCSARVAHCSAHAQALFRALQHAAAACTSTAQATAPSSPPAVPSSQSPCATSTSTTESHGDLSGLAPAAPWPAALPLLALLNQSLIPSPAADPHTASSQTTSLSSLTGVATEGPGPANTTTTTTSGPSPIYTAIHTLLLVSMVQQQQQHPGDHYQRLGGECGDVQRQEQQPQQLQQLQAASAGTQPAMGSDAVTVNDAATCSPDSALIGLSVEADGGPAAAAAAHTTSPVSSDLLALLAAQPPPAAAMGVHGAGGAAAAAAAGAGHAAAGGARSAQCPLLLSAATRQDLLRLVAVAEECAVWCGVRPEPAAAAEKKEDDEEQQQDTGMRAAEAGPAAAGEGMAGALGRSVASVAAALGAVAPYPQRESAAAEGGCAAAAGGGEGVYGVPGHRGGGTAGGYGAWGEGAGGGLLPAARLARVGGDHSLVLTAAAVVAATAIGRGATGAEGGGCGICGDRWLVVTAVCVVRMLRRSRVACRALARWYGQEEQKQEQEGGGGAAGQMGTGAGGLARVQPLSQQQRHRQVQLQHGAAVAQAAEALRVLAAAVCGGGRAAGAWLGTW